MNDRMTCVITGGTSGIGKAVALALSEKGYNVALIGRNAKRGKTVIEYIRTNHPGCNVRFYQYDLSRTDQIPNLAQSILSEFPKIDVLINNAGARNDKYYINSLGIESTFAINHLAHFYLTLLLLDSLISSGQGRVINVSSGSHSAAQHPIIWNLSESIYERKKAYAQSKLANIVFSRLLSEKCQNRCVTAFAVNPGGVASCFALNNGVFSWMKHIIAHLRNRELITPKRGADTIYYLSTAPIDTLVFGGYYYLRELVPPSPLAFDKQISASLWKESLEMIGINETSGGIPHFLLSSCSGAV